jgi:alkaline phosphatase D
MSRFSRRAFLRAAGAALVGSTLAGCAPTRARFAVDPFTLGVASGAPRPDGVVLWTRLAPDPFAGGGLDPLPIAVDWEIATDDSFRQVAQRGRADADPVWAHSVHVEVEGLQPGRWYWYRFRAGDTASPIGRTRTAPAPDAAAELRIGFASCQQYEQGYYAAHRHLAEENPDLVIFLGDYIYESSWGARHVRQHERRADPVTLEQYRNRYACYKSDPDLQRCHASAPWIVTWDDHEVENDYADDRSPRLDPDFLQRRAAAYQAFYEHMPLRASARPRGSALRLYDRYDFGRLLRLHVLDDRQYRSHQVCPPPGRGGSNVVSRCPERLDEQLTLLGFAQERWLADGLASSGARWNVIAQQTLMAQKKTRTKESLGYWTDGWDGYPAARGRLLQHIAERRVANPIVIGGDVHANYVCDLKTDFDDPRAPVIATEFCGTSISSQGPSQKITAQHLDLNPHIKFARGDKRGYVTIALDDKHADVRLRVISNEKHTDAKVATLATFSVAAGRPGAERA